MKKPRELKERDIKKYLVQRVKALGGELRKVAWEGRANAPDWVVMLPWRAIGGGSWCGGHLGLQHRPSRSEFSDRFYCSKCADELREPMTTWVELKNPQTIKTFPANAHERAQHREHERMRKMGQRVEVIGTFEQVDALLA